MRMREAFKRVAEREQATSQVRRCVAFEFEHHRLGAAFHPDFAPDRALLAIIDFPAHDTVMNSKSHSIRMGRSRPNDNSKIWSFWIWRVRQDLNLQPSDPKSEALSN